MAISKKMLAFSERSSWIRRMFEEGARMKAHHGAENVFDFSLGNPDLPPPPQFQQILSELASDESPGMHSYMPNMGYPGVREAVAAQVSAEQTASVVRDDIIMTCGAAGALNIALKALLDPGDEVIILAPFFVEYNFYVDNHGGVCRVVQTDAEFNLDIAAMERAVSSRTKAVIINSPNNPTGQIYPATDLESLGELLAAAGRKHGTSIYLLSDEPYRKIVYDDHEVPSVFMAYPNSMVLSSYSKDLSLPGERIGYIAVNPETSDRALLLESLTLANRILGFVNAPALMQRVVARLQGVTVDTSIYAARLAMLSDILSAAGYEFCPPKGAFYLFPRSPLADDVEFVRVLQKERILAVPGRGFGAPGYFRLAFCVEEVVIAGAAAAFGKAIAAAGR